MELSSEDALRLNVLLANEPQAIRIDESRMIVHGLSVQGEARITLNPTGRDDRYLRVVRELIAGHVMGSPGGYPVFLRRWTRMGERSSVQIEKLLMLGEAEAVVAVALSPEITPELARRAWWALETADNARSLLRHSVVVDSDLGLALAAFLVEFLPFEEEPVNMMESVRLVLQPGLIGEPVRDKLWQGGKRKTAYLVGFLQTLPDTLPEPLDPHPDRPTIEAALGPLVSQGNAYAQLLLRISSAAGQTWFAVVDRVLAKPPNQEVVQTMLETIAGYFAVVRPDLPEAELDTLISDAAQLCAECDEHKLRHPRQLLAVQQALPQAGDQLRAMLCLARLGYAVVRPVLSRTDAIGSLMRRKLEPVVEPLRAQLSVLGGRR